ncbi:MAG: diguanylate cyclase [Desulfosudaceae bacterium]
MEKRSHPRINVPNATVVLEHDKGLKMGQLADISLTGAGIFYTGRGRDELTSCNARLHILTQQPFLYLENVPFYVVFDVIIASRDRWDDPQRRCGLRFHDLSTTQQNQLTALLRTQQTGFHPEKASGPGSLEEPFHKSQDEYRLILDSIIEGYFEVDMAGNLIFFNHALAETIGYSRQELMGVNYRKFMSPETARRVFRDYNRAQQAGRLPAPFDWELVRKDGTTIHVETSLSFIKDPAGNITGFRGIACDISSRKKFEQELLFLAAHDQLTGLYNRGALFEKLRETIAYARRFNKRCALLFLDLDNFKAVNDRFGHASGDQVLRQAAGRLTALLRQTDYVCRHGGDEFTIILNNADQVDPVAVARKIGQALRRPYVLSDDTVDFVSTSIGISLYPDDGRDIDALVRYADKAMYKAKKKKNRHVCYNQGKFTRKL